MASRTASKDIITLRGSAAIVSEFFGYAANSILYNRAVYPEESFTKVKKYGLTMLLTQDEGVKTFLTNLTSQLSEWLEAGKLQRIVLVIMSKATNEVLERWNFNIVTDSDVVEEGGNQGEERQRDHEGDPSHHAPDRVLHHLPPLPRRTMRVRRAGLHGHGRRRAGHLGRERRQAHRQSADG